MRISVLHLALLGAALAVPLPSLDASTKSAESTELIARNPMVVAARTAILVPDDDWSLSAREAEDDEEGELEKRSPEPAKKKKKKSKKQKKAKKKAKAKKKKQMSKEMDNMSPEDMETEIASLKEQIPDAKGKQKKQMKSRLKMLEKKLGRKNKGNTDVLDQPDQEGGEDGGVGGDMFNEPADDTADPAAEEPVQRRDAPIM